MVDGFPTIPATFDEAKALLLPRVMGDASYAIEYMELSNLDAEAGALALTHVTPEIMVGASLQTDLGVVKVTKVMCDDWGVSVADVAAAAAQNALGRDLTIAPVSEGTLLITDEYYAAALWSIPKLVESLPVQGDPVVIVVTQEHTIVTGSAQADAAAEITALFGRIFDSPAVVESVTPYVLRDGEWSEHVWPDGAVLAGVEAQFSAQLYSRQQPHLQELYAKRGVDVYIADCPAMKASDGSIMTVATWTEGVLAAIPVADIVYFVPDEGESIVAEWDDVVARFGDRLQPANTNPQRYFTNSFPTTEELQTVARA